jgi:hypothetical protein
MPIIAAFTGLIWHALAAPAFLSWRHKKAARLIISKENPLTLKASQSDRLCHCDARFLSTKLLLSTEKVKKGGIFSGFGWDSAIGGCPYRSELAKRQGPGARCRADDGVVAIDWK